METITRNVKDIEDCERQVLERVIGQHLAADQQLIIQVANLHVPQDVHGDSAQGNGDLPEWCHVYSGLSDEAISSLEETVLKRAELSRPTE
jgi:hypothetical protein